MNDSTRSPDEAPETPSRIVALQRILPLIVIAGAVIMFMLTTAQLLIGETVTIETNGDSTIYRANSYREYTVYMFSVMTTLLAVCFLTTPGVLRFAGVMLALIAGWQIYTAVTMDTSNHNVTVTPTGVTREVGTTSNPIRHEIDFTKTAYLYIDHVPGNRGPKYELVGFATEDGTEIRVPISSMMMRAALPQIMENASKHDVVIVESSDGSVIPPALQVDPDE